MAEPEVEQATKYRWAVQHGFRNGPEEFVAAMCWVSNSGTLQIGNHVDGAWVPDAMFNAGEWSSARRVEE